MSITEAEFEQLKTRRKVVSKTNIERLVEEARAAKDETMCAVCGHNEHGSAVCFSPVRMFLSDSGASVQRCECTG